MKTKEWKKTTQLLEKEYLFADFKETMRFVNRVAELSEQLNHHPDMYISYHRLKLSLWTHTTSSVTEKDLQLADAIDKLES